MELRRTKKRKLLSEINVVPYIDVMLVLLIIFMVTAPLLMQGVEVELPDVASSPMNKAEEPLIVSIRPDGSLYLNLGDKEKTPQPIESIKKQVSAVLKNKPQTAVLVWGDRQVPYGEVVKLMAHLQAAGAESVGLVTEPPR
jgi:biopolymer transport protein TolR